MGGEDLGSILYGPDQPIATAPARTTQARPLPAGADPAIITVLGEAGSNPAGQRAVASVIANRLAKHGGGLSAADLVTDPGEGFEAWNNASARNATIRANPPGSPGYKAAQDAVGDILTGKKPAPFSYTAFYGPKAQAALGRQPPSFDDGSGVDIGGNRFFAAPYAAPADPMGAYKPTDSAQAAFAQSFGASGAQPAQTAPAPAVALAKTVQAPPVTVSPIVGDQPIQHVPTAQTDNAQQVTFTGPDGVGTRGMTPAQRKTWDDQAAKGQLDPSQDAGSWAYPKVVPPNLPAPPVLRGDDYYIGPDGVKKQYVDPDPMAQTAGRALLSGVDMMLPGATTNMLANLGVKDDPRYVAAQDAFWNNAMLGGKPTIEAGIQSFPNLLTGDFGQAYQHNLSALTAEQDASRARFPLARDVGAIAGTGATLPATEALRPFEGASLLGRMGNAATIGSAYGGAQGFMSADRGDLKDRLNAGVGGAAVGAVAGPALELGGNAAGRFMGAAVAPARAQLASTLMNDFGIPLRAGQISTSPATRYLDSELVKSGPYQASQATQVSAFNKALAATIGEDAPGVTPEVMNNARSRIGAVFNDVASKTSIPMDDTFITKLGSVYDDASKVLGDNELRPLYKQIEDIAGRADENGNIPGDAYQAMTRKGSPLDVMSQGRDPKAVYAGKLRDVLDDALEQNAAPEDLQRLQQARLQWKNMRTIQGLASKASPDGEVSPALLLGAVRKSYADMPFTGAGDIGTLAQGAQAFLKDMPDSGTASRLGAKGLLSLLTAPTVAAGALGAAFHQPLAGLGAAGGLAALWASKKIGETGLSAALDNPLTRNMLLRSLQHEGGNAPKALPALAPQGAMLGSRLYNGLWPQPTSVAQPAQ